MYCCVRSTPCRYCGLRQARLRRAEARRPGRSRQAAAQRADDLAAQGLAFGLGTGVQQRGAARQVVEHQQRARRDVVGLGAVVVHPRVRRQPLEITHQVVARDTDETAVQREAGVGNLGPGRSGERATQGGEQFGLVSRSRQPFAAEAQACCVEPQLEAVAEADEGIAREPLAPLHAFQQEARPERLELEVGRHRGVEVGRDVEQAGRH